MSETTDSEARKTYAQKIVQLWMDCIDFAQEAQKYFLRGEIENDVTLEYVARLARLWKELKPKVNNRSELKDLVTTYMSFDEYCSDPLTGPKKLLEEPAKINELENVLCDTLDKLGLTSFETLK